MENQQAEWFKDTEFWEQYAPVIFDDARWAEVSELAEGLTRLAKFKLYPDLNNCDKSSLNVNTNSSSPKVLDLCCGFGRISAELARRGFSVTGVDITESYLDTAREEAGLDNLDIEYVLADTRDFVRPDYFDLAVNLYISLGYFDTDEQDLQVLRNVYKSLKKDGTFIIETLGKEIAVRDFIEAEWFERAGFTVLTEYEALDSWTRLKNRWILIKGEKRIEKVFSQRLYAASELKAIMSEAGFINIDIFGDWDEKPYDHNAKKLIAVGRK